VSWVQDRGLLSDGGEDERGVVSGDCHGQMFGGAGDAPNGHDGGECVDGVGEFVEPVAVEHIIDRPVLDGEVAAAVREFFGFRGDELGVEFLTARVQGVPVAAGELVEGAELVETPGVRVVVESGHGDSFRCRVPRAGDGTAPRWRVGEGGSRCLQRRPV